ncbi:hypothetical protein BH10ACI1_BH10ACI1_01440 [soil metagenome]
MPLFEITKPMNATVVVECAWEKEAINWSDKIVADIQDENGNQLESKEIILFDAVVKVSEIKIEKLHIQ